MLRHALTAVAAATAVIADLPIIQTTQGYVRGTTSPFRDGAATVYKGIPYASPPTGSKRWTEPTPAESWSGVLNATEFGPQCAQSYSSAGIFSSGKSSTSEDCLTLNIWTPSYDNSTDIANLNLPVFFWIYGGRFTGGSGDVITYDGTGLASKNIIVVTINYRLGAFGYLAHPELSAESAHNSSGNYGILDQQLALRWVYDNIENFGGNKSQIVTGGQSAGSASALDTMWSPLVKGLVAGVIAESGARAPRDPLTGSLATSHRSKDEAEAQGVAALKSLNVSSIAEMRNQSTETLIDISNQNQELFEGTRYENLTGAFIDPPLWRPVIDGYVLPTTYYEALRTGNHTDVPIMTGNNADESGASLSPGYTNASTYVEQFSEMFENFTSEFLSLYPANDTDSANNASNAFWRDNSRVSTRQWAQDWAAGGAKSPVYVYYFTHTPAENPSSGAYHGSELWYTFRNIPYSDYSNVTWTAYDLVVEDTMSQYWINFISTGNPNGGNLTEFPSSTTSNKQTMWLGNSWGSSYITQGSDAERKVDFIERWYSTLGVW
ncbi:carboxylesterase [Teratosphaeria nubilosa]|uniref:Carboxylesterase n=1 Tax=Teratosphaeria nubilosa TaxID=161662 RepID=A0A6G1LEX4_9PEZI|nr:carboxylesterase [Teratosphaeria nubilosa]